MRERGGATQARLNRQVQQPQQFGSSQLFNGRGLRDCPRRVLINPLSELTRLSSNWTQLTLGVFQVARMIGKRASPKAVSEGCG